MEFLDTCSDGFGDIIAIAFCLIVVVIPILVLARTTTRAWLLGLIIVPFVYQFVAGFSTLAFIVLSIATLGLPVLLCSAFL